MIKFNEIVTISLVLFAIIDILGSIPVILDLKKSVGHVDAKFATLISGSIMIIFLFTGDLLLKIVGIDLNSFSIAGAIVIFLIGLEMTLNRNIFKPGSSNPKSSSVVPIAFPMIAGAGTLTTLLSLKSQYNNTLSILIAICLNLIIIYLVIKFIPKIERILGDTGISILRKVFGIILLSIAIKIFSSNIYLIFNSVK